MEYKNTAKNAQEIQAAKGLNPCSNGIQKYDCSVKFLKLLIRLNPCSNGIQKYHAVK